MASTVNGLAMHAESRGKEWVGGRVLPWVVGGWVVVLLPWIGGRLT